MASLSLVYFLHCKFVVQTQRKELKIFVLFLKKRQVSVLDRDYGNPPPPRLYLLASPLPLTEVLGGEGEMGKGQTR